MILRGLRCFVVCFLLALAMSGGAGPVRAQEGLTPDLVGTALTGHAFQFITNYGTVRSPEAAKPRIPLRRKI